MSFPLAPFPPRSLNNEIALLRNQVQHNCWDVRRLLDDVDIFDDVLACHREPGEVAGCWSLSDKMRQVVVDQGAPGNPRWAVFVAVGGSMAARVRQEMEERHN